MKTTKIISSISMLVLLTLAFSGCKKDDPAPSGKAFFWTASVTAGGSYIDIYIGSAKVGRITSYASTGVAPACGSSGYVTASKAPGTYDYTATGEDGTTWSGSVTITNGTCTTVELTEQDDDNGKIVIWVNSDFECGNIDVTIGSDVRTITSFYNGAPSCYAAGCATFSLPDGTYDISASCTGLSWTTTVTFVTSTCRTLQLTD